MESIAPPIPPPTTFGVALRDTCAMNAQGSVECWGVDESGEDGTGSRSVDTTRHLSPVCAQSANEGAHATGVAMGAAHTCALISGAVQCWGDNSFGQLGTLAGGLGTTTIVNGLHPIDARTQIAAGGGTTCVLYFDQGDVWCWGQNNFGQLGNNTVNNGPNPTPARVQTRPARSADCSRSVGSVRLRAVADRRRRLLGTQPVGQSR